MQWPGTVRPVEPVPVVCLAIARVSGVPQPGRALMTTVSYVSVWHIIQRGRPAQGMACLRQPDRDPYREMARALSSLGDVKSTKKTTAQPTGTLWSCQALPRSG